MRQALHEHRRRLVAVALASVPLFAALATVAFGWHVAERLLLIAMAILALLLVLKLAVVALSIGVRALL